LPDPRPRDPLFDEANECIDQLDYEVSIDDVLSPGGLAGKTVEIIAGWKERPNFEQLRPLIYSELPPARRECIRKLLTQDYALPPAAI